MRPTRWTYVVLGNGAVLLLADRRRSGRAGIRHGALGGLFLLAVAVAAAAAATATVRRGAARITVRPCVAPSERARPSSAVGPVLVCPRRLLPQIVKLYQFRLRVEAGSVEGKIVNLQKSESELCERKRKRHITVGRCGNRSLWMRKKFFPNCRKPLMKRFVSSSVHFFSMPFVTGHFSSASRALPASYPESCNCATMGESKDTLMMFVKKKTDLRPPIDTYNIKCIYSCIVTTSCHTTIFLAHTLKGGY